MHVNYMYKYGTACIFLHFVVSHAHGTINNFTLNQQIHPILQNASPQTLHIPAVKSSTVKGKQVRSLVTVQQIMPFRICTPLRQKIKKVVVHNQPTLFLKIRKNVFQKKKKGLFPAKLHRFYACHLTHLAF